MTVLAKNDPFLMTKAQPSYRVMELSGHSSPWQMNLTKIFTETENEPGVSSKNDSRV